MAETIQIGNIVISFTQKDVKHVHLSVHPPSGRVTLVAPTSTRWCTSSSQHTASASWR